MLKKSLKFLAAGIMAAALVTACSAIFDADEDPVEYDAQGRRLVTVSVALPGDDAVARAVTKDVAAANIDFYEVVFRQVSGTLPAGLFTATNVYYSATGYKGAGKELILKIAPGNYYAVLFAGKKLDGDNAVLLATDISKVAGSALTGQSVPAYKIDSDGKTYALDNTGAAIVAAGSPISFTLKELELGAFTVLSGTTTKLSFTGSGVGYTQKTIAGSPAYPYWSFDLGDGLITAAAKFITTTANVFPAYTYNAGTGTAGAYPAIGAVTSGDIVVDSVGTTVKDASGNEFDGIPLALIGPTFSSTASPVAGGDLEFSFVVPESPGVTKLGFDVSVLAYTSTSATDVGYRNADSTVKAITWHVRNGLDNLKLDTGAKTADNSGAGILIAAGVTAATLVSVHVGSSF
ncbi:hypothetical protein [Treponema primitia]|uniref:hypothetical protein n=1 Tax=Treponema primitia TaxID=88058 RepID=UPI00025557A4|nr:hypothetical protein [Treponema primitia]